LVVHEENEISKNNFSKLGFIESGIIELETKFKSFIKKGKGNYYEILYQTKGIYIQRQVYSNG
jgi:L-amino acid N-acyltransferase YncA